MAGEIGLTVVENRKIDLNEERLSLIGMRMAPLVSHVAPFLCA
jgi:hypothetical protein